MGLVAPKNTLISFDNYVTDEKDLSNLYKKLVLQESVEKTHYIPLEIILKENYFPARK